MNIGRYAILEELGRGSMGVVYKAHDPNLDLVVALKVLRLDRMGLEGFDRRFLAEAKAMGRLDHPNIVRVFNVDEDGGTIYIAMEFLEGQSLGELIARKRFTAVEIAEVGAAVADALDYAHGKGIIHRDIKPSNIFLRSDGRAKITDFGIARIEDPASPEMTQAGEILGTPAYMSPEQLRGHALDGRSDIFSLGIVLYEMCAGRRPFGGSNIAAVFDAILREEPAPLSEADPTVPPALARIVSRCLRKEASERFAKGSELSAALGEIPGGARREEPSAPAVRRRRGGLVAAAAVLALFAAGGYVLLRPASGPGPQGVPAPAATPAPRMSSLGVESTPRGAQLFVDGKFRGNAPMQVPLVVGKHEVRLTMDGHEDWEAQVDLGEGETPLSVTLLPKEKRRRTP